MNLWLFYVFISIFNVVSRDPAYSFKYLFGRTRSTNYVYYDYPSHAPGNDYQWINDTMSAVQIHSGVKSHQERTGKVCRADVIDLQVKWVGNIHIDFHMHW